MSKNLWAALHHMTMQLYTVWSLQKLVSNPGIGGIHSTECHFTVVITLIKFKYSCWTFGPTSGCFREVVWQSLDQMSAWFPIFLPKCSSHNASLYVFIYYQKYLYLKIKTWNISLSTRPIILTVCVFLFCFSQLIDYAKKGDTDEKAMKMANFWLTVRFSAALVNCALFHAVSLWILNSLWGEC